MDRNLRPLHRSRRCPSRRSFRLRHGVITAMTAGLPDLRINCLLPGDRDEVYAGTNRGLARWDGTRFTQTGLSKALRRARILALAKDRDANFWIGTAQGLLRSNPQGLSSFDE